MASEDVVWALHPFEAENPDEISFAAGEPIVVIEKDDMFGDGWWQGRNVSGQTGLFPESYTSRTKPVKGLTSANGKMSTVSTISEGTETGGAMMQSTMSEVDRALEQQQQAGTPADDVSDARSIRSTRSARSVRSRRSRKTIEDNASIASHDMSETEAGEQNYPNARSALAARAKIQLQQAAQAQKDRERDRQMEQDLYMQNGDYMDSPPIEGLEISDESEGDDDDFNRPTHFQHLYDNNNQGGLAAETPTLENSPISSNSSPFARNAEKFPLPPTQPNSPAPNGSGFAQVQSATALISPQPVRGHSPSGSISSRRSRKSFDASALPPVPPVPAVIEDPVPTGRPQSFTDGIRRSLSLSRRSSKQSLKRRSSVSSQKRPTSTIHPEEEPQIDRAAAAPSEVVETRHSLPRTKSGTFSADLIPVNEPQVVQASPRAVEASSDPVYESQQSLVSQVMAAQTAAPVADQRASIPMLSQTVLVRQEEQTPISSPTTAATYSRPGSQAGYTNTGYGNSIRTLDTSPRSSVGGKLPSDPRSWNVEQVVEWGRSKSFDALTLAKFQEHEISGDVLLEMDINTLKEIDLPAFGRRVHINNGIKELKRLIDPSLAASTSTNMMSQSQSSYMQYPPSMASPAMSGYEPDTPGNRSTFSPSDTFSPQQTQHSGFQPSVMSLTSASSSALPMPDAELARRGISPSGEVLPRGSTESSRLRGLGLEHEPTQPASSSSVMQRAMTDQGPRAIGVPQSASSGHKRSLTEGTIDTFNTANGDTTLVEVTEEPEPTMDSTTGAEPDLARSESKRRLFQRSQNPSSPSLSRTSSRRRTSTEPETTATSWRGSNSVPSSPVAPRAQSKKNSFFGATLNRSRKPPPASPPHSRHASEGDRNSKSRRSIFGFNTSPAPASPIANRPRISVPLGSERPLTQSAAPVSNQNESITDDAYTAEPETNFSMRPPNLASSNAMDPMKRIGKPDLDGWLSKKNERYGNWKMRYAVLKGMHLYLLKSPTEKKVKGWIALAGYKILPDSDSNRGSYGFKMTHPTQPSHFFSSADPLIVRKFMKALMKSSISRDMRAPVIASSNIPTMSLEEAQAMFPPPRPPSPTSRDRLQKERLGGVNPNSLTPRDAEILTSLSKSTPTSAPLPPKSSKRESKFGSSLSSFRNNNKEKDRRSMISVMSDHSGAAADQSSSSPETPFVPVPTQNKPAIQANPESELLDWVNAQLPYETMRAINFSTSFQSGEVLARVTESVSGVIKPELQGDRFNLPAGNHDSFAYVDALLDYFDYLLDLKVDTQDVAVAEVLRGDSAQIIKLVKSIKDHFENGTREILA